MKSKPLSRPLGRSFALAFDSDDDVLDVLGQFVEAQAFAGARFYGIGGFCRATLGYYDVEEKRYRPIEVDDQVEVLSFIGNVAAYQGKARIHAHCVVGHRDGRATGGHLLAAVVRPTLELMVDELSAGLERRDRPDIGIPLLDF